MTTLLLDNLDITSWVLWGTLSVPTPAPLDTSRLVTLALDVDGTTTDELLDRLRQVQAKLTQAQYAAQPWSDATRLVMTLTWGSSSDPLYLDMLGGALSVPPETLNAAYAAANVLTNVALGIVCLPFARGAPITVPRQLLAYSSQLEQWNASNATVLANNTTAFDGTLTADKVLDTATSTTHLVSRTVTTVAGDTHYFSVVAKLASPGYTRCQLRITDGTTVLANTTFRLDTGAVFAITSGSAGVASLGGGWYRCTVWATNPTTTTTVAQLLLVNTSTTTNFLGTGTDGIYASDAYLSTSNPGALTVRVQQTATNLAGLSAYAVLSNVPGDAPALIELEVDDLSSAVAVNTLRVARHAAPDVSAYTPLLDATTGAAATTGSTGTDYVGAGYATDVVSTLAWEELATFSVPMRVLADGWLRVRDSAVVTGFTISSLTSELAAVGGALGAGSYTYIVAVYIGASLVAVSASRAILLPEGSGTASINVLDWKSVTGATDARIYWKRGTDAWRYLLRGSGVSDYRHSTETGAVIAEPPATTDVVGGPALLRAKLLVGTQAVRTLEPRTVVVGQGRWERLLILPGEALPPYGRREQRADVAVTLAIEGLAGSGSGTPSTVDVDALTLLDVGQGAQLVARNTTVGTTPRRWVLDTARDGAASGVLLNRTTGAAVGLAAVTGNLTLEPVPMQNHLTFMPLIADDVASAGVALGAAYVITPRFRSVGGSV